MNSHMQKSVLLSLFLFSIPLFSADRENKQELDLDAAKKKQLVREFVQQFEDETGITDLTTTLIRSAKNEADAIALCKKYIKSHAKSELDKFMYQGCAQDALMAWCRATGNKKPRSIFM
jgi:hypothetical protein